MHRTLRWLDGAGAIGLVLVGSLHVFVGAPAKFDSVSADLFWFLSAGLALWYAGAANLVRQYAPSPPSIWASVVVNLTLLGFIIASGLHSGELAGAGGMFLAALAAIETIFALSWAYSLLSARTHAS